LKFSALIILTPLKNRTAISNI